MSEYQLLAAVADAAQHVHLSQITFACLSLQCSWEKLPVHFQLKILSWNNEIVTNKKHSNQEKNSLWKNIVGLINFV